MIDGRALRNSQNRQSSQTYATLRYIMSTRSFGRTSASSPSTSWRGCWCRVQISATDFEEQVSLLQNWLHHPFGYAWESLQAPPYTSVQAISLSTRDIGFGPKLGPKRTEKKQLPVQAPRNVPSSISHSNALGGKKKRTFSHPKEHSSKNALQHLRRVGPEFYSNRVCSLCLCSCTVSYEEKRGVPHWSHTPAGPNSKLLAGRTKKRK